MSPSRCSPPAVLLHRISLGSAIYFLPPSKIHICTQLRNLVLGFPGSSDSKGSACSTGDPGSIPGSGRSRGEGNGNLLQYPCLENPMDGGTWQAAVHGVAKSQTQLSKATIPYTGTWSHDEAAFPPKSYFFHSVHEHPMEPTLRNALPTYREHQQPPERLKVQRECHVQNTPGSVGNCRRETVRLGRETALPGHSALHFRVSNPQDQSRCLRRADGSRPGSNLIGHGMNHFHV